VLGVLIDKKKTLIGATAGCDFNKKNEVAYGKRQLLKGNFADFQPAFYHYVGGICCVFKNLRVQNRENVWTVPNYHKRCLIENITHGQ